ncbi:Zn(2)-C6 fungal-type DNA-binding domain protein [Niveomyces insectorum RCEF 264]|uniref:Zn(2)-C6 fungal-type DNA-binding domain protein n=1 Tax=Niveomyces insectorum RCEF 264 TaxID=1081102 RepID=A0A168AH54_9HYPO|nr:Zn(2)-C6 fungal-type DNA-binding domain protein [Niveomyces insectorum RCEF 264]
MAPTEASDIPAGFFSTFSIVDPNNPAPENVVRAQKRNRRVFVCIPCHRRKLRCDKLQPCTRCVAAGIAGECVYQPAPAPAASSGSLAARKKKAEKRPPDGKVPKQAQTTRTATSATNKQHMKSVAATPVPSASASSTAPSSPGAGTPLSLWPSWSGTATATVPTPTPTPTPSHPTSSTTATDAHATARAAAQRFKLGGGSGSPLGLPVHTKESASWHGATHWKRIASEFKEAAPIFFGTDPQWQPRYRRVQSLRRLFPAFPDSVNFPFGGARGSSGDGSDGSAAAAARLQILRALPPVSVVSGLADRYTATFGAIFSLFAGEELPRALAVLQQAMLQQAAPEDVLPDAALAQLCMVLALGAAATTAASRCGQSEGLDHDHDNHSNKGHDENETDAWLRGSGQSAAAWTAFFLQAAQACFGRTEYMAAPSLTTVRTLCLMVLAKLVEAPASGGSNGDGNKRSSDDSIRLGPDSHSDNDDDGGGFTPLVSLTAFVLQMARSLQLHRSQAGSMAFSTTATTTTTKDCSDADSRRRVWLVVRLLVLETAMRTGTTVPPLTVDSNDTDSNGYGPPVMATEDGMDDTWSATESGPFLSKAHNDFFYRQKRTTNFGIEDAGTGFHDYNDDTDGFYQNTLATFLPLVTAVVNAANTPTRSRPGREQVQTWHTAILQRLRDAEHALMGPQHVQTTHAAPGVIIARAAAQYQFLDVLGRRALLGLHHAAFCASLPPSPDAYPGQGRGQAGHVPPPQDRQTQAAVLTNCLALLDIQQTWARTANGSRTGTLHAGGMHNHGPPVVRPKVEQDDDADAVFLAMLDAVAAAAATGGVGVGVGTGAGGAGATGITGRNATTLSADALLMPSSLPMSVPVSVPASLSGRSSPTSTLFGGSGSDLWTADAWGTTTTRTATAATAGAVSLYSTGWLLDLCHDDFAAAMLYLVLVLRAARYESVAAPTAAQATARHNNNNSSNNTTTARKSAFLTDGILGDREADAVDAARQGYQFEAFLRVALLFACFRGLRGPGSPGDGMRAHAADAADDVEKVVVAAVGGRAVLWNRAAMAAAAPAFALDDGGVSHIHCSRTNGANGMINAGVPWGSEVDSLGDMHGLDGLAGFDGLHGLLGLHELGVLDGRLPNLDGPLLGYMGVGF